MRLFKIDVEVIKTSFFIILYLKFCEIAARIKNKSKSKI